jgi:DNA-binding transcriptional LysR family regulator
MLTLDQLRIFAEVAACQHLTQAARALALTPAAVSAAIKSLESRHGTPLFDRVGRGIVLNAAGINFLPEARAALASARAAEAALAGLGGLQRGSVTVHASQTIASYWLPARLAAFRQAYPGIALELVSGNTQSVAQAVAEGRAELGLVEGGMEDAGLERRAIGGDQLLVVTGPDHPWAGGARLEAADLMAGRWILREAGSGTRAVFEAMLSRAGAEPRALDVVLALPSNEAVCAAVLAGPYAAVVSELVVGAQLRAGQLARANADPLARSFHLLRHPQRSQSRAAAALERLLGA